MEERNILQDIKRGASDVFEVLKVEISKFAKEIEKQGSIVKRKMDLSSIQRLINQSFTQLGSRIYELTEEGKSQDILKDELVSSIISQINDYKKEAKWIEDEIERIRRTNYETFGDGPPKRRVNF